MDDHLKRAFAEASVPGDDPAFLARVHGAVAAAERQRRWRRAVLIAALAVLVVALTPAVVEISLAFATAASTQAGALIVSTLALCAGALLARRALR
jgi:hypothetical protein